VVVNAVNADDAGKLFSSTSIQVSMMHLYHVSKCSSHRVGKGKS